MLLKRIFIALLSLTSLTDLARSAPYVVLSGTDKITSLATGNTQTTQVSNLLYIIVDIDDTSNYAVMEVNSATKVGTITGYPIAGATTGQANANFFGGIVAASRRSGGLAIFTSGSQVVDGSNNTAVERLYGTGDLNTRSVQIVPGRNGTLVVRPKVNGVNGSPVSFGPSAAINAAIGTFPATLNGTQFGYTIAADGSLTNASTSGTFGVQQNGLYTILANIGGSYPVNRNVYAVQPVANTGSETNDLRGFFAQIAADLGYTVTIQ